MQTLQAIKPPLTVPYRLRISDDSNDEWDSFLRHSPYGHHLQSSLWGKLKASIGWRFKQLIAYDNTNQIVGGAQILFRPMFAHLSIGYLPKGPVLANGDSELMNMLMQGVKSIMRQEKIVSIIAQPADDDTTLTNYLRSIGFVDSPVSIGVDATVKINLAPNIDDILTSFKSKTRYNVRLGQRKGVTVRSGKKEDLPQFHELLKSTGARQNFSPNSLSYFYSMWDLFAPHDHVQLFMTYFQDELVSANLSIAFGNTVLYKRGGWSGRFGNTRPNEVMHWAAIQWSKENGYKYYDLEGIDVEAATAVLSDKSLPGNLLDSTTRFKLGFGDAIMLPPALIYSTNRLIGYGLKGVLPRLNKYSSIQKLIRRLRKG